VPIRRGDGAAPADSAVQHMDERRRRRVRENTV